MLWVTSQRDRGMTFSARVSEYVDKTIVISRNNQGLILGETNMINMCAVCSIRENSVNQPSKLWRVGVPLGTDGVWGTARVLGAAWDSVEKKFMSAINCTDILGIQAPVYRHNEWVVLFASSNQIVWARIVDIDTVIMRTYSKHSSARRVLKGFNPLLRIILSYNNLFQLVYSSTNS